MNASVLLVDDDEFARCFVRTVLQRAGYEVHEAVDVAGALAVAPVENPVAVVTDWNLLDGNGEKRARHALPPRPFSVAARHSHHG